VTSLLIQVTSRLNSVFSTDFCLTDPSKTQLSGLFHRQKSEMGFHRAFESSNILAAFSKIVFMVYLMTLSITK
jgi:hypothetical protein